MSNTDWYALAEAGLPWKAFNGYANAVNRTVRLAHGARVEPTQPSQAADLPNLDSVALEAQKLWEALPPSQRTPKAHRSRCSGLPRSYPKLWMARPHSNSLMFEMKEIQSLPNSRLKGWKN